MPVLENPNTYLAIFARLEKKLPGNSLPWLNHQRQAAMKYFETSGFPTPRQEAWRFTNVEPIAKRSFKQPETGAAGKITSETIQQLTFPGLDAFQLVFINGQFVPALSNIPSLKGVQAGSLATFLTSHAADLEKVLGTYAVVQDQPFTALNTAFFTDGAHVYLSKETVVDKPIHLVYLSTSEGAPTVSHPRTLIVGEQGSKASFIETFVGPENQFYWTNAVTEIMLGENSRLDHYKLQRESRSAYHISTLQVQQARSSIFNSQAFLLGAALSRNNINVEIQAEGAECTLYGLYMTAGTQLTDTHTWIHHAKPHGSSRELYKGILDDQSRGVFDGSVLVAKHAQKTDAMQTNKNLLLSNEALVNTKPELKIFANDVKCKHGATVGQISAESLFYLRSRGIPLDEARRLLIRAFASEMIELIEIPALRDGLEKLLFSQFQNPK